MPKRLRPTNEVTDGESEEAEQQERSRDGGVTSVSEALCWDEVQEHYQMPSIALTSSDAIVAGSQGGVNVISTFAVFTPSIAST
jgi:hypothetical protein